LRIPSAIYVEQKRAADGADAQLLLLFHGRRQRQLDHHRRRVAKGREKREEKEGRELLQGQQPYNYRLTGLQSTESTFSSPSPPFHAMPHSRRETEREREKE
jgi:hypothetical protein